MRLLYVVTYDISSDKRLRAVFKLMRGYGERMQYSVFRCELSDLERMELIAKISERINHNEDQVLFFPLGPVGGARESDVLAVGKVYAPAEHGAVVI